MFLLYVCLPIRLQTFQGQRLPDSLFAPLVPGRALEPSACSVQASLNKYAECGRAEKLCFCSRGPLGTHLHQHCPAFIPNQNGLPLLLFIPSKGPAHTAGQRSSAKVPLAPEKALLLSFFFPGLTEGGWGAHAGFSCLPVLFHLSLLLLLLELRMG